MENASFFINSTSDNLAMKPTAPTKNQTLDYLVARFVHRAGPWLFSEQLGTL